MSPGTDDGPPPASPRDPQRGPLSGADTPWPASALYHEQSKLSPARSLAYAQSLERYREPVQEGLVQRLRAMGKRYPTRPQQALPSTPRFTRWGRSWLGGRLLDTLRRRRSLRVGWTAAPLSLAELGPMLAEGFGLGPRAGRREPGMEAGVALRPWPSAGALYPLELYVIAQRVTGVAPGAHHYEVQPHALAQLDEAPWSEWRPRWLVEPAVLDGAACAVVITARFAATQEKYGERGYRFTLLEAGHAAQNLLLLAAAMGLLALPVGGFHEDDIARGLGLDPREESPVHTLLLASRGGA
jgi:SagB-type dehydrogenase family enzyme